MRLKSTFLLVFMISGYTGYCFQSGQTFYHEDFEGPFAIQSFPDEFLPFWFANELRSTSSRVFKANSSGLDGSACLAVQPISSFDGEIWVRLFPKQFEKPRLVFWAKSMKNGSGTRAAELFYSWSSQLGGESESLLSLGSFANEDQDFRKVEIPVPDNISSLEAVFLKLEVRYGAGAGSCARFMMDGFQFGDWEEDTSPPELLRVRGYDADQIEVQFSEAIDPVFSTLALNYSLDGVEPLEAVLKNDSLVYLTFARHLEMGKEMDLKIQQIPDREGNFLKESSLSFVFYDPTVIPSKTLVINELMPAPKADLDLPNAEYIELLHVGAYPIRLEGVQLANSRTATPLNNLWLEPDAHVLLVSSSALTAFEDYGIVLPVDGWPALLNAGDQVTIFDDSGQLIDRVSYSTVTWGGAEWSGGGYSLEVVNPLLKCEQSSFLQVSQDPRRGTPGARNSVWDVSPDLIAPTFSRFWFESEQELVLEFSEPLQAGSGEITFSEDVGLDTFRIEQSLLRIQFSEPFPENFLVILSLNAWIDCSGNELGSMSLEIIKPSLAVAGEIFINELLFNPRTGSPKFVELFNATTKHLEIGAWHLANEDDFGEIGTTRQLSESSLVMPPNSFLAITTDTSRLQLDYPRSSGEAMYQISSLPSYPIGGGVVLLVDANQEVVESFAYSEDQHHPLLRDPKGVSLERMSVQSSASLPQNWQSASEQEGFATPGRQNSQNFEESGAGEFIQVSPEVFDPEGINGNTFTTISYELDQPGWVGSFAIYDLAGRMVASLAMNELLGAKGVYTWSGTDQEGKRVKMGYYVLLVELFDLDGRKMAIKRTLVVAGRL